MKNLFIFFLVVIIIGITSSSAFADEQVPSWVKNTAGWWATDAISETEFVNAIEFLVKDGIISVNKMANSTNLCENINNLSSEFDKKTVEEICKPFYNLAYEDYKIFPAFGQNVIDNHGFRCNVTKSDYTKNTQLCEFPKEKPSDVYRIFLIGGSTMFSSNNDNAHTASAFLQEKISSSTINKNIQVINAGISGSWSEQEVKLVKNKILDFEPDLLVVYDGYNDLSNEVSAQNWRQNWTDICNLGIEENFQTIIFLQPFLGTSYKTFFDFEYDFIRDSTNLDKLEEYETYRNQLPQLNQDCYGAYDLTNMFDKIPTQIFFDSVHVGSKGDKILADNFFKFISPILNDSPPIVQSQINSNSISSINDMSETILQIIESDHSLKNLNFENSKLSDLTLEQQDITNSIFYKSVLKNINFKNADLTGTIFTGADLDNVDFTGADLTDTVFFKTKLNNVIFSNANFDQTSFVMIDFTSSSFDLEKIQKMELIHSKIPNVGTESDTTNIQINKYKPIDNRETFVELSNTHESVTNIIDFYGTEVKKYWLFELVGSLQFGETGIYPYEFGQMTYKTLACNVASMSSASPGEAYANCIYQDDLFFQDTPFNDKLNEIVPEMNDIYMEIMNEDDKTIVIFPTVSLHAYSERCIWDYYMPASDDCKIIQLNNDIDLSSMNNNIWLNPAWKSLSGYFLYNTNVISFQILGNLNYEILSDIEIEKNPSILESYDKIIVLQNKYVTKKMFDAITNHPKVIYLTPGALSEEVKIDFTNNTITVLSPIKYPEEKNYRNDFSWEYDNTDREFEDCSHSNDPKFEKVSNGIMTNCVSENLIGKSKEFLKIIKDY